MQVKCEPTDDDPTLCRRCARLGCPCEYGEDGRQSKASKRKSKKRKSERPAAAAAAATTRTQARPRRGAGAQGANSGGDGRIRVFFPQYLASMGPGDRVPMSLPTPPPDGSFKSFGPPGAAAGAGNPCAPTPFPPYMLREWPAFAGDHAASQALFIETAAAQAITAGGHGNRSGSEDDNRGYLVGHGGCGRDPSGRGSADLDADVAQRHWNYGAHDGHGGHGGKDEEVEEGGDDRCIVNHYDGVNGVDDDFDDDVDDEGDGGGGGDDDDQSELTLEEPDVDLAGEDERISFGSYGEAQAAFS